MNENDRQELERLSARQARLEQELNLLSRELRALSGRLTSIPEPQIVTPPVVSVIPRQAVPQAVPPPIPAIIPTPVPADRTPSSAPEFAKVERPLTPRAPSESSPVPPATQTVAPAPAGSFEMKLGTYWLVRIGIVMLLTGLVFFGNYTYQSFVSKLGAPGKIGLMYFGSALLMAAGAWWQRKRVSTTLRNYAEVLFAGGLAGVYFTTYAAHHLPHLRIIQNPVLDGFLLVAWAALIVWIADRRKSEVLAMFAIGLAYYASIVTRAGEFTLWSNLVLSTGAVVFLVRNRWAGLSIGSLIATYGGYVFWRFLEDSQWRFPAPDDALQLSAYFLCAYWIVFTAAVFLARGEKLSGLSRASFLTANNAAFFTLFILTMYETHQGGFWKISLAFGIVLLALAEASRRFLSTEPLAKNFYLTQGLLLVTIGIIAKFSGFHLALLLGAQSIVLLALGDYRQSKILRVGACISGVLATFGCFDALQGRPPGSIWFPVGLGAMFIANTVLSHTRSPGAEGRWFRLFPSWFTILALLVWLGAALAHAPQEQLPLVIASAGLLLTLSIYVAGVREIMLFAQGYLLLAPALWIVLALRPYRPDPFLPWWNPALMAALVLAAMHWWQKQRAVELSSRDRLAVQAVYAGLFVLVLQVWIYQSSPPNALMAWTAVIAVSVTLYGALARAWMLSAMAQGLTIAGLLMFITQVANAQRPHWGVALAPMVAIAILATGTRTWFHRRGADDSPVREPLLKTALIYRCVAVAMSLAWVLCYVPQREFTWVLMLAGAAAFGWAGWRRDEPALWFSGFYWLAGLVLFFFSPVWASTVYLPNLAVIVGLGVLEHVARQGPDRFAMPLPARRAMVAGACLAFWVLASRYVLQSASGFYLTACWSVVALLLFGLGIVLRERTYRWFGLGVLACSVGRVVCFDVWKLQTLYRVLSFMALGTVLMVLGFVYNKYQERIKQWL